MEVKFGSQMLASADTFVNVVALLYLTVLLLVSSITVKPKPYSPQNSHGIEYASVFFVYFIISEVMRQNDVPGFVSLRSSQVAANEL